LKNLEILFEKFGKSFEKFGKFYLKNLEKLRKEAVVLNYLIEICWRQNLCTPG
jgi:hypothetical protein